MRYLLSPNNTLIVRGPASLQLVQGDAEVLGAKLGHKRRLVVMRDRQLPIEAKSQVDFEILGELANVFEVDGSTIPASWVTAADEVSKRKQGKIMVIGGSDVGKNTFCTYLANVLLSKRLKVRIIDVDLGQADIGPPTTIGSAVPSEPLSSMVDLKPNALIFIGHTNPSSVGRQLTDGIRRLVRDDESRSFTIINTDGWTLESAAILYKRDLISAVDLNFVIGLSANISELQPILSSSSVSSMIIDAADSALIRSRSDRRMLRRAGYRRFLDGGKIRTLTIQEVKVKVPEGPRLVEIGRQWQVSNLLAGLLNEHGYLLNIGVLMSFEKNLFRIYARSIEGARELQLGYVRLSLDGEELGYVEF